MMKYRSLVLVAVFSAFVAVSVAHATGTTTEDHQVDYAKEAKEAAQAVDAIRRSQEALGNLRRTLVGRAVLKIQEAGKKVQEGISEIKRQKEEIASAILPGYETLVPVAQERAVSNVRADNARTMLDNANYQIFSGYAKVSDAGAFGKEVSYSKGLLATQAELARLHGNLFCNPENRKNPPAGCGRERAAAGIEGNDNFLDFFLSDRTWPRAYVFDALLLARAFFFGVPERLSIAGLKKSAAGMIAYQQTMANAGVRMAVLDELAARRAPTSTATEEVMSLLLNNFAVSNQVSSTNIADLCKNPPEETSMFERYACSITNNPQKDKDGKTNFRIMSQASIDRVLQNDYYMSTQFYDAINASGNTSGGALDRMEVYMLAQQVVQDYRFLHLLEMDTAVSALRLARRR